MCWELLIQIKPKQLVKFRSYVNAFDKQRNSLPFRRKIIWISDGKKDSEGKLNIRDQEWYLEQLPSCQDNPKHLKSLNKDRDSQNAMYRKIFCVGKGPVIAYQIENSEHDTAFCGCNAAYIAKDETLHLAPEVYDFIKTLFAFSSKFYVIYFNDFFRERLVVKKAKRKLSDFVKSEFKDKETHLNLITHKDSFVPNQLYEIQSTK